MGQCGTAGHLAAELAVTISLVMCTDSVAAGLARSTIAESGGRLRQSGLVGAFATVLTSPPASAARVFSLEDRMTNEKHLTASEAASYLRMRSHCGRTGSHLRLGGRPDGLALYAQ